MKQKRLLSIPLFCALLMGFGSCEPIDDALENIDEMCALEAFEVTTTEVGEDPNAFCRPGQTCTLRSALNSVTVCSEEGPKLIRLQPGEVYDFVINQNPPPSYLETRTRTALAPIGESALPVVWNNARIDGQGATIEVNNEFIEVGILVANGGTLQLQNLTLAGIRPFQNDGNLILEDVVFEHAAAIDNRGDATLRNISARGEAGGSGNKLINAAGATMRIEGAQLEELDSVTLVHNAGRLIAQDITITRTGSNSGFGMEISGDASAVRNEETGEATVRRLTATETSRGPVIHSRGTLTVEATTITGATVENRSPGIDVRQGTATITDTTISGSTQDSAGAIMCRDARDTTVRLNNVVLRDNHARLAFGAGGLTVEGGCVATVSSSQLTGNTPRDCNIIGTIIDGGGNTDSDGTCL